MNYSVESVRVPPTETGPKCTLALELQDWPRGACTPLFIWLWCYEIGAYRAQWWESLWLAEALPGLMVGKSLIGQDFVMQQEDGVRLLRYLTWVWWLSRWYCFPSKFGGKPTHVVHGKGRPSCYCTTLSPRSLMCPRFITKTTYNNHIAKINQE